VKLNRVGIPGLIWLILNHWYSSAPCSVLLCGDHSIAACREFTSVQFYSHCCTPSIWTKSSTPLTAQGFGPRLLSCMQMTYACG